MNIYQMNHLAFLENPEILMKPVVSAAAILITKAAIQSTKSGSILSNLQTLTKQDYALAGGIGAGFLVAKIAGPFIAQQLNLGTFFGALENRIIEVGSASGALYALDKAKIFGPMFPTNQGDIISTAIIIGIADMLGEEAPVFFGLVSK